MKTAKNGDCLLCPKAPSISPTSILLGAAVDRAGCPHFLPRPLSPMPGVFIATLTETPAPEATKPPA